MRLWTRSGSGSERRAHRLVADYLGARSLPAPLQAAIERAVAEKLAWSTLPALDDAMRASIDLYAWADPDGDDGPVTIADVRRADAALRRAARPS